MKAFLKRIKAGITTYFASNAGRLVLGICIILIFLWAVVIAKIPAPITFNIFSTQYFNWVWSALTWWAIITEAILMILGKRVPIIGKAIRWYYVILIIFWLIKMLSPQLLVMIVPFSLSSNMFLIRMLAYLLCPVIAFADAMKK